MNDAPDAGPLAMNLSGSAAEHADSAALPDQPVQAMARQTADAAARRGFLGSLGAAGVSALIGVAVAGAGACAAAAEAATDTRRPGVANATRGKTTTASTLTA